MRQRLKQALSRRQKSHIADTSLMLSAVLVPIYYKQGQYYILFTKRTEKVTDHKGEISFPGGAYQEGDGMLVNTALRESAEEIGLKAGEVGVLGELDDTASRSSNYIISPVVAFIPWPYQFEADEWEVEEIIEIPILALLDKERLHQETEIVDGKAVISYYYHYQGRVIWGATARILHQFLDIFAQVMSDN